MSHLSTSSLLIYALAMSRNHHSPRFSLGGYEIANLGLVPSSHDGRFWVNCVITWTTVSKVRASRRSEIIPGILQVYPTSLPGEVKVRAILSQTVHHDILPLLSYAFWTLVQATFRPPFSFCFILKKMAAVRWLQLGINVDQHRSCVYLS